MPNHDDLKILFAHSVPSEAQLAQYHEISTPALILAQTIVKHCAPSAATDMAIHMLYTAVQIAKAQIASSEEPAFPQFIVNPVGPAGTQYVGSTGNLIGTSDGTKIVSPYPAADVLAPEDARAALTPEGEAWEKAQAAASLQADKPFRGNIPDFGMGLAAVIDQNEAAKAQE